MLIADQASPAFFAFSSNSAAPSAALPPFTVAELGRKWNRPGHTALFSLLSQSDEEF